MLDYNLVGKHNGTQIHKMFIGSTIITKQTLGSILELLLVYRFIIEPFMKLTYFETLSNSWKQRIKQVSSEKEACEVHSLIFNYTKSVSLSINISRALNRGVLSSMRIEH